MRASVPAAECGQCLPVYIAQHQAQARVNIVATFSLELWHARGTLEKLHQDDLQLW